MSVRPSRGCAAEPGRSTVDEAIAAVVATFGLTEDPSSAFYIAPDGGMIDGTDGRGGVRHQDHRMILGVFADTASPVPGMDARRCGPSAAMTAVLRETGILRWSPEAWLVRLHGTPPTTAQVRTLVELSRSARRHGHAGLTIQWATDDGGPVNERCGEGFEVLTVLSERYQG